MRLSLDILLPGDMGISASVFAQVDSMTFAGGRYTSGQDVEVSNPVTGDAFMPGLNMDLAVPVLGNAHVAGQLCAVGYSITVIGTVRGKLTAAANQVTVLNAAPLRLELLHTHVRQYGTISNRRAKDVALSGVRRASDRTPPQAVAEE